MQFMLDKKKLEMIQTATEYEISDMVLAIQQRYNEMYPDWELTYYCLERKKDKNEQLDAIIALLERLKDK